MDDRLLGIRGICHLVDSQVIFELAAAVAAGGNYPAYIYSSVDVKMSVVGDDLGQQ